MTLPLNSCWPDETGDGCPPGTQCCETCPETCCTGCYFIYCVDETGSEGSESGYTPYKSTITFFGTNPGASNIPVIDPTGSFCCIGPGTCGIGVVECGQYIALTNNCCCTCPPPCEKPVLTCSQNCGVITWTATNADEVWYICDGVRVDLAGTSGSIDLTFPQGCTDDCALFAKNDCGQVSSKCCGEIDAAVTWGVNNSGECVLNVAVFNACSAKVTWDCAGTDVPFSGEQELTITDYCDSGQIIFDPDPGTGGLTRDCSCTYKLVVTGVCGEVVEFPIGTPPTECCQDPPPPAECCCAQITGYEVLISGITNDLCDNCDELNGTICVPKVSTSDVRCSGSANRGISDCSGLPVPGRFEWEVTCDPATGATTVRGELIFGVDDVRLVGEETYPAGTPCSDLVVAGSADPGNPGTDNCDYTFAAFVMTPILAPDTCP